ncbi:hypothetical protein TELCIR_19193, partial [Teladorsagia circumcincta]
AKMADLEAVLADVSYLMAMEKSRSQPAARASKRIVLPDPSPSSIERPSFTVELQLSQMAPPECRPSGKRWIGIVEPSDVIGTAGWPWSYRDGSVVSRKLSAFGETKDVTHPLQEEVLQLFRRGMFVCVPYTQPRIPIQEDQNQKSVA